MKLDDSRPIFRQLADQIRQQIIEGHLAEEEQVMSTTQYAQTLRINPATVARAFAELTQEGLLYKKRGIGMFVAEGAQEKLLSTHRQEYFDAVLRPALEAGRQIGIKGSAVSEYVAVWLSDRQED